MHVIRRAEEGMGDKGAEEIFEIIIVENISILVMIIKSWNLDFMST